MKKNRSFLYDKFSDRLMISNNINKEIVNGSARLHNLTLDFSSNGKVLNIEIKNVSDYLEMVEINPQILEEMINANFMMKQTRDGYLIYFIIKTPTQKQIIPFNLQTNQPIVISS